jgi:large subunit ribosomal protein L20
MARVKTGVEAHARHKKTLKQAKGYYGAKHRNFKTANTAVIKSLSYAYTGRKLKKRQYRRMWISRINAAARQNGLSYSRLMHGLKASGIDINRKMLSEIAIHDQEGFAKLCDQAKKACA